ncbi:MAG: LysM peptidoglycan-binding domain-containing protein, partial [Phycisphaerae bacterium]|nr:LysM peptidoglycan-binding domain-containing protein [Phycisphaerae bacterium]
MALNMKAALMICSACIAGMTWFLQTKEVRQVALPSPLLEAEVPIAVAKQAEADEWGTVEPVGWREGLANQFEYPNAIDELVDENRSRATSLAVAALVDDVRHDLPPVTLPPLVSERDEAPVATVAELADDSLAVEERPSPGEAVVLADARSGAEAGPVSRPVLKKYRVVKGDNLTRIAGRECGSRDPRLVKLLMDTNPRVRKRNGHVLAGEALLIPDEATARQMLAAWAEKEKSETKNVRWYTIKPNDSLTGIARRYLADGRRWREILQL